MLLVGDSVLKGVDIRNITPTSATTHKLCVPGMACEDIVQELCESRGGRPGLSVLTSLLVSVDVKNY